MIWGRDSELKWLERNKEFSQVLVVQGIAGVGKSRLVWEWIHQTSQRHQWFNFASQQNIQDALGASDEPLGRALHQSEAIFRGFQVVVWDNVHFLPQDVQSTLLSFLTHFPSHTNHVLITDESLNVEFLAATPVLTLQPLSLESFAKYLKARDENFPDSDVKMAYEITGGIPLLINAWLQTKELKPEFGRSIMKNLPKTEAEICEALAVLNRPSTAEELSEIMNSDHGEIRSVLERLRARFLIQAVSDDLWAACDYFQTLLRKMITQKREADLRGKILAALMRRRGPCYEGLKHALWTLDETMLSEQLDAVPVSALEQLPRCELQDLLSSIGRYLTHAGTIELNWRVLTLKLKALFQLGERSKAKSEGLSFVPALEEKYKLDVHEAQFVALVVQILLLSDGASQGADLIKRFFQKVPAGFQPALQLDLASVHLYSDPQEALRLLNQLETHSRLPERSRAQLFLQKARALDFLKDLENAEKMYLNASRAFVDVGQDYFAAVAELNRIWCVLKMRKFDLIAEPISRLKAKAETYGYSLVLAGSSLIESEVALQELQLGSALQKIDRAMQFLGPSPPATATFDALVMKIQILCALGLHSQAGSVLEKLKKIAVNLSMKSHEAELSALELLIHSPDLNVDSLLDRSNAIKDSSSFATIIYPVLLHRGLLPEHLKNILADEQHCIRIQCAQLEFEITERLKQALNEEVWFLTGQMDRLLDRVAEPLAERVATYLLQANLSTESNHRRSFIEKAKTELSRWGSDPEKKYPFVSWIAALEDQSDSPASHPAWRVTPIGEQLRWGRWWKPLWRKDASALFIMISRRGIEEIPQNTDLSKLSGVTVDEILGEVWCGGEKIEELTRGHVLRRVLSLLIEMFPNDVKKASFATAIWGEDYDPNIHDSRIYTSIQRIRGLLHKAHCILKTQGGYRWNQKTDFQLIQLEEVSSARTQNRIQNLILRALQTARESGRGWVSRSELVAAAQTSESTVKRELSKLLAQSVILRRGGGRSVVYSPNTSAQFGPSR